MSSAALDRVVVKVVAVGALVFLVIPLIIVIPMSFSSAPSLAFPPPGFSWRWYQALLDDHRWATAALNSAVIAASASTSALVLGGMAAHGLVRGRIPGRSIIEGNFMAPLIVPPVVSAVALYIVYARIGLLGTYAGLIIAHTILAVPYVVLLLSVAIRSFDHRIEQVAATLGASWWVILTRILLPNLAPSVVATWILAFIVSFDEIILTFFLFGNRDTISKRMFVMLEQKVDPTITVVATLLIAISAATLLLVMGLLRHAGIGRTPSGTAAGTARPGS